MFNLHAFLWFKFRIEAFPIGFGRDYRANRKALPNTSTALEAEALPINVRKV
jgi:hypothetical protein